MNSTKQPILFVVLLSFAAVGLAGMDARGAQPGSSNGLPSDQMQVRLIKNALIALNHANVTGNYTVLRDLCSPQMRERRKASDLALAFHNAHDRNRDLSFVMEMKPIPAHKPTMSPDGRMRLVGYFPTRPLVLHYDLVFLKTARGDWWIDGIVVATQPARPPTPPATHPQTARRDLPSNVYVPGAARQSYPWRPNSANQGPVRRR